MRVRLMVSWLMLGLLALPVYAGETDDNDPRVASHRLVIGVNGGMALRDLQGQFAFAGESPWTNGEMTGTVGGAVSYYFSRAFAAELGGRWLQTTKVTNQAIDSWLVYAAVKGETWFVSDVGLYAKLGVAYVVNRGYRSASYVSPSIAFGLQYKLSDGWRMTVDMMHVMAGYREATGHWRFPSMNAVTLGVDFTFSV